MTDKAVCLLFTLSWANAFGTHVHELAFAIREVSVCTLITICDGDKTSFCILHDTATEEANTWVQPMYAGAGAQLTSLVVLYSLNTFAHQQVVLSDI